MPKFFIYDKIKFSNKVYYEPFKIVYVDVRDGAVLQPDACSLRISDSFEDDKNNVIKEYPEREVIAIKQTSGAAHYHLEYQMEIRAFSAQEMQRLYDAIEEYDQNNSACLERYHPLKEQPQYPSVNMETIRAAALGTISHAPAFTPSYASPPENEKREKPTVIATSWEIAQRHEWPACVITEERAKESGARNLNGDPVRWANMFPKAGSFKIA